MKKRLKRGSRGEGLPRRAPETVTERGGWAPRCRSIRRGSGSGDRSSLVAAARQGVAGEQLDRGHQVDVEQTTPAEHGPQGWAKRGWRQGRRWWVGWRRQRR